MVDIQSLLGDEAESLLTHESKGIPRDDLHLPGPDFVDRVFSARATARRRCCATCSRCSTTAASAGPATSRSCPVDQGIEHSGAASLRAQPALLRPGEHRRAGHRGRLQRRGHHLRRARGGRPRSYAHKHPLHRQAQPQRAADLPEQVRPDHVRLGRAGLRPGRRRRRRDDLLRLRRVAPARSRRSARPSSRPTSSACSPCCGATCATPPSRRTASTTTTSADLTGQANHLGVTIEADIIKQKLPENNGGYNALDGLRQDQQAGLRAS